MLRVIRPGQGSANRFKLAGVIDESVDFERVLGALPEVLELDLREVRRINSIGIKTWRDFFNRARRSGKKFRFHEISPPMVQQIGFVSDFVMNEEISSLCAPFYCEPCKSAFLLTYTVPELEKKDLLHLAASCPSCQGKSDFDELAEQYFAFLLKR